MPKNVRHDLRAISDPQKAAFFPRFFKTSPGQYGEGDRFYGVTVPNIRRVAKQYAHLPLKTVEELLNDPVHEVRLCAVLILVDQFQRGDSKTRGTIAAFYAQHAKQVNNWDLVDSSAPHILGTWLLDKDPKILREFAKSQNLWEQRIAIVATYAFIRRGEFDLTLKIAKYYLKHPHDLIHKATGWMLREVGKRDESVLRSFLDEHGSKMPRTMLRYAIEKLSKEDQKRYLLITKSVQISKFKDQKSKHTLSP